MSDWNEKIIKEFRANEGRVGGPFTGSPMILIHHVGARTGTERVAPLVYFPQPDGSMLIIASRRGAPTNPDWYHNLKANPKIDVEVAPTASPSWPTSWSAPSGTRSGRCWWPSGPASAATRRRPTGSSRCSDCAAPTDPRSDRAGCRV